jgi:acetyl esterase/lipase
LHLGRLQTTFVADTSPAAPFAVPPDEETLRFNEALERALSSKPSMAVADMDEVRRRRARDVVRLAEAVERRVPGPAGDLKLRTVVPGTVERAYLHFHDGGWASGGADMQDWYLKLLSERCSAAVVSVEYRLSPEHPYPAAPDDCEAAALWFVEHAQREFGTGRLVIGGESAGAHLAAVTLLRLRDRHGRTPFSAANFNYGCFDLGLTPSARNFGARELLINTPACRRFNALFVGAADPSDPDVSPLYAALHDLPPALFTVGTLDPLLDDSLFMHARWRAAGNAAELAVYGGCTHGFNFFRLSVGTQSLKQQFQFIVRAG